MWKPHSSACFQVSAQGQGETAAGVGDICRGRPVEKQVGLGD